MNQTLKKIGIVLMGLGGLAMLVTVAGMIGIYRRAPVNVSASALSEDISATLLPTAIGAPVFTIGLVLFVVGWFRGHKTQPPGTTANPS